MSAQGGTRFKVWLVLIGVFALGSVTGASIDAMYRLRSSASQQREDRHAFLEKMRSELKLTNEQTAQINVIVNDTRNEFRGLKTEVRPRFETIRQKERERIRALLTTEQQQLFAQMIARKDAEREKRDKDER